MNRKSWLVVLVALLLGAGGAVAITQGMQEDAPVAATPAETTETEKSKGSSQKTSTDSAQEDDEKDAGDEAKSAEQQVEHTVNTYVEALAQGDTEALCEITAESLTVKVTASGVSGEEIAEACAEAASQFDWAELWAGWASQIDLDDVQVTIDGSEAKASLEGGASFSLDRQRSGEWKVDGWELPGGGGGRSAPQAAGRWRAERRERPERRQRAERRQRSERRQRADRRWRRSAQPAESAAPTASAAIALSGA
jgi:hypothetical protein